MRLRSGPCVVALNSVFALPEQKNVEWHSDRIPLPADPDGLQDPRVSQLVADQLCFKHSWLLNAEKHVRMFDKRGLSCSVGEETYLHVIWLDAADKKRVAPEIEKKKAHFLLETTSRHM